MIDIMINIMCSVITSTITVVVAVKWIKISNRRKIERIQERLNDIESGELVKSALAISGNGNKIGVKYGR